MNTPTVTYTPAAAAATGSRSYIFTLTAPKVDNVQTRLGYAETFTGTLSEVVETVARFTGDPLYAGAEIVDETAGDYFTVATVAL